jgi:putative ABC transport system permease protein
MRERYGDITQQGQLFGIFAGIAVFIACLGLLGLAASATERRTKEVGIRKAMGASSFDVVKLFLCQFTAPVLVAAVIALPLSFLAMDWWLHGFAYHVNLSAWTFVLAATLAAVISLYTVSTHTWLVARAKPVGAQRYE